MDTKTIEAIQARMSAEADYQGDLLGYQNIFEMKWELPGAWAAKDWIRKQVSTDGHDAIHTATNIYDTNRPKWEVLPRGLADKDRAERLEVALEWWMQKANMAGDKEPLRKALHYSCLQNRVVYQLDYLPYWLPKNHAAWTDKQKAAVNRSPFCITSHDSRNIYFETGKYGQEWVASVTLVSAQDVINHWNVYADREDGEEIKDLGNGYAEAVKTSGKIKSALSKIKKALDDKADLMYIHVDYVSMDRREVSVFETSAISASDFENYSAESGINKIDIVDAENELGFINWVVVEGDGVPMLYSIHKAGLWENQNLYNTLIESITMRRGVFPILKHISNTGRQLDVDYTGEQDVIEMTAGEQADVMIPPPIDPALSQIAGNNMSKIAQATGIKGLASIEIAGNVQYAAVQSVIQLHMTSIRPYIRTVEKANIQLALLMFQWIRKTGVTETAYRTRNAGAGKAAGTGVFIEPDFNPEELYIECELIANTPTDKQQLVNMYSQLKQAGAHIAWKEALEKLSLGNGEVLEAEWLDEEIQTSALQLKIQELQAALQLKTQAAQMQFQIQMQQQQQSGQGNPPQGDPTMPGGNGFNAAAGGQPTAEAVPGATSPVMP